MRSLFGIIKTTKAIAEVMKTTRQKDEGAVEYVQAAQEQLRAAYAAQGNPKAQAALEKMPIMKPWGVETSE